MMCRKPYYLIAATVKKWVSCNQRCLAPFSRLALRTPLRIHRKGRRRKYEPEPRYISRPLHRSRVIHPDRAFWICQDRDYVRLGYQFSQQFYAFVRQSPSARKLTPVALPPGRARLATRANLTGSSPVMKVMGMVDVAVLAAIVAGALVDAITGTCRLTRSAASRGNRSRSPSAHSNSIITFRPTSKAFSFRPSRNAATRLTYPAGDALLRNPTTGIAGCCARAAMGSAAVPASPAMNSRRRIIRSPRRR